MYNYNPYSYNSLLVNSIEEAKNAPIDFTGNPVLYLNKVKNEVYLKQFDMASGKTFFGKYIFTAEPAEEPQKDDIKEMLNVLNDKYNYLYKKLTEKETKSKQEKAVKDDE